MPRTINFNAGPASLPLPALERAQAELLDFAGSGMSVMEHSHRGKQYEAVHNEAVGLLRELLGVPADYEVLFLQGGASMQFAQIPMNFLPAGGTADYVITGLWGEKAFAEAKAWAALNGATAHVAATTGMGQGDEKSYSRTPVPVEMAWSASPSYVHFTSNETVHGVEYATAPGAKFPDFGGRPVVCDMSSDFLWRKIDVRDFSFIYAGAQKNIGPSGVTVVVAKKEFLDRGRKDLPKIFQYRTHAANNSLYHTPPTFGIYLVRNVLSWVKSEGGLEVIEQRNREKAALLYAVLRDHGEYYRCPAEPGSRSMMNVVFRLPTTELDDKFVAEATKRGMVGLKGYRTVGGVRASIYNAVTVAWVQTLADFMREFVKANPYKAP